MDLFKEETVNENNSSKAMSSFGEVDKDQFAFTIDEDLLCDIDKATQNIEIKSATEIVPRGAKEVTTIEPVVEVVNENEKRTDKTTENLPVKPLLTQEQIIHLANTSDNVMNKMDSLGNKGMEKVKRFTINSLSLYQDKKLKKKFEKGELIEAGDFLYLLKNDELMVYKYQGNNMSILIPDRVGCIDVKYIHPGFLTNGLLDNHKVNAVKSLFSEENLLDLSLDNIKECAAGIQSIQLPINLVQIPGGVFRGCKQLWRIVIPSNVKIISPHAFSKSGVNTIYFDGDTPRGLNQINLGKNTRVYCKQPYTTKFNALFSI